MKRALTVIVLVVGWTCVKVFQVWDDYNIRRQQQ